MTTSRKKTSDRPIDVSLDRIETDLPPLVAIAQRLGRLRRERGITQAEMAGLLGVSQPIVSDYERGELRLHGELIVRLCAILNVSADDLLGIAPERRHSDTPNRRLRRQLQLIDALPKRDQEALHRTINAFLSKGRSRSAFQR